jgi:glyoxylase-like metal-dependent hydrolase (beta-lactamase superfamily II)
MTVGPAISLYFDRKAHLLRRSERVLAGVGLVEYRFDDYVDIDGIPFNRNFRLILNGDENMQQQNKVVQVNKPLAGLAVADAGLQSIPAIVPDDLARQEIAEGVYLIGGSRTYAMFVEMEDYVVAAGGTAGIPERIELLREIVPDKPIRYAVMTHHHFDHVVGVSAYEAEGATLIAASAHEQKIRDAAANGADLRLRSVDDELVFEDGSRKVRVIDIGPTAHTEHLLVTYLADEGIVFEADHFALPQVGPVPPAVSSTKSFAAALVEHDIAAEKIVSAHSPRVGTMGELRAALEKDTAKVSQR